MMAGKSLGAQVFGRNPSRLWVYAEVFETFLAYIERFQRSLEGLSKALVTSLDLLRGFQDISGIY